MDAVSEALDQVDRFQDSVNSALVPDSGVAALHHLQDAEQHLDRLKQLSSQLQQLTAAVTAATPPVGQPPANEQAAQTARVQEQAKQAAAALQQAVAAALGSPNQQLCCVPQHTHSHTPRSSTALWDLLHSIGAAAPHLQLHLFRSSIDCLVCSYDGVRGPYDLSRFDGRHRPTLDAAAVARISGYVDEVRVVCPGVFVAAVALQAPGRLRPLRVCFDSADKAATVDPWAHSKHQVFKRLSLLSVKALLHFQHLEATHALLAAPHTPPQPTAATAAAAAAAGMAEGQQPLAEGQQPLADGSNGSSGDSSGGCVSLEALLLWLACHDDLFSRPCDASGQVITWAPGTAAPLPAYVRPYWLSLDGLRQAASNKACRKAYHAHLAPWPHPEQAAAAAVGEGAGAAAAAAAQRLPWVVPSDDEIRAQLQRVTGDTL